ncbi:uncharacterized protein C11orf24 homolog [Notothenia coriiceps]|uniref:Uncharacterized protein C11orf24 homolog n=1 Tax=Notothenia coriiceps TaxID=8208 RepID=A0A6I9N9Z2_9TELE|nr:PREDICTED: uncharacterized protein C11orf24 homolog [Notothenia coriiceps]
MSLDQSPSVNHTLNISVVSSTPLNQSSEGMQPQPVLPTQVAQTAPITSTADTTPTIARNVNKTTSPVTSHHTSATPTAPPITRKTTTQTTPFMKTSTTTPTKTPPPTTTATPTTTTAPPAPPFSTAAASNRATTIKTTTTLPKANTTLTVTTTKGTQQTKAPSSAAPPPVQTSLPKETTTVTVSSTTTENNKGPVAFGTVVEVAVSPLTLQLVDTASLLSVLLFGLLFFLVSVAVFVTQAYESYRRKDYTQVDYLINGMYTDSGV